MKIQKLLGLAAIAATIISCQKDDVDTAPQTEDSFSSSEISIDKETISKIESLNLNPDGVETITLLHPDGSEKTSLLIEGDLVITPEQLSKMSAGNITDKQYRTYNLVSTPKVIQVVGVSNFAPGFDLTAKQTQALTNAIANYNDLNIGLSFELTFTNDLSNADILIFQQPGDAGGVAGFPTEGNPYNQVVIFSGMERFSLGTNTHVMAHEIGHTLGLRHTDWFTRESCGRPSFGEVANPTGAVHIPGTPFRLDPTSIMLSCFSSNEDGEFGPNDVVALEYLY